MSTKDHLNFKSPNHAEDLLKKLQELWCNGRFCDVQLAVQEKQFSAHRNVLSACSPYFQAMFAGGLAEEGMAKVELHEVDLEIFSILLDFMYTGEVDVRNDNCQDLLAAADMFGLPEVMTACCEFMKQQIHPSNCLGIYDFADAHACQDLKKYTEKYIHKHFLDVVKEEEFFLLPKETVIKIFQSEELRIENEFQVFSAAMDWINHDIKARRPSVFDVLNPVRLSIISPAQLEKHIIMCEDLSLKVALRKIIQDIKTDRDITSFGLKPHKLNYYQKHHVQPRRCARKMIYVIGGFSRLPGGRWSDSQTLNTVECFDSFRQQWKTVPSIKFCRSGHGVTVLDGNIYVIGGESDSLIFDTAEHLDPVSNHWSMLPSMTVPRCGLGVCTVDDFIYALGGWVGSEIGDTIECYNPTLNVWSKVGKLVTLRFAMGVVEHEGFIYVLGGMSDLGTEMKTVERYNPATNEWTKLASMKEKRAYIGVTVLDEYIYAVGGWNEHHGALKTVERYYPRKNEWTSLPTMSEPRAGASVAAVNGLVFVIGGRTSSNEFTAPATLDTVECFDPHTWTWIEIGKMPTSRCEAGIAVL